MVLTKKRVNEELKIDTEQFKILDLKEIKYDNTQKTYGYSIEILNLILELTSINKMCSRLKSELYFNTEILHAAIDNIFNKKKLQMQKQLDILNCKSK